MQVLESIILPKKPENKSIKLSDAQQFPFHNNKCECLMCKQYETKVLNRMLEQKSKTIYEKIRKRQSQQKNTFLPFQYVLKRLITPNHKLISQHLNILIPEICFYKDGQAVSLFMNVDQVDKIEKNIKTQSSIKKQQMIVRIKKQKLTNTQIQKIFNQKRRKYKQRVNGAVLKRKLTKNVSDMSKKEPAPQMKESVLVVSYLDGYEQVLTENEFINLTLKRKQDPIFRKINFIKNFLGTNDDINNIKFVKYDAKDILYPQLFNRAKILIKIFATNIIPGQQKYISSEDETKFNDQLIKESKEAFVHYTTYKIVNFIQTFYDEKINILTARFLINERDEAYLIHVYSLKKEELIKYTWTQDTYMKKVEENENKLLSRMKNMPQTSQKNHRRSEKIEGQMRNQFEGLKISMGLGQIQRNDQQQIANNNFFALLHPNLDKPISQILKNKNMTISKFKKDFLGYKNKKRSVAQDFNSNLVKTLHKLTPQLHLAEGHQVQNIFFPRKPSLRGQYSGKRSLSLGNTMSTVNKTMSIFL